MGRCAPEQHDKNITLLMDDVQLIRQQLTSSIPVPMTENNQAYELAMETVVSEISIRMPAPAQINNTCSVKAKPRCSTSVPETKEDGYMRCCFKCGKSFSINCKVSGHSISNLSCNDCEKFGLINPTAMWRQCKKCQHMIDDLASERDTDVTCCATCCVTCRYRL